MALSDLDLNLLTALEALYEERSVTRAARRMSIGQPAMSDALRRLRVLFGDELFVRASGGMQPTPRAHELASEIGPLLSRIRAAMGQRVVFAPKEAERTFTIASTDFTTMVLLPSLMRSVRDEAPSIDLRIFSYDKDAIAGMLDRGEVDVALGVFPNPPGNLVKSRLFDERFVGLAREDHPALRSDVMELKTFAELPQALVSLRRDERGIVDSALEDMGLRRRVALVVPYMLLLPEVLASTDLIAVIPERAARAVEGRAMRRFELPFPTKPWVVEMLWSPAARTDQANSWLRKLIAATAKSL